MSNNEEEETNNNEEEEEEKPTTEVIEIKEKDEKESDDDENTKIREGKEPLKTKTKSIEKQKSKAPADIFLSQQTLPSCQALITIHWILGILITVFILFLVIGLVTLILNLQIKEIVINYGENKDVQSVSCEQVPNNNTAPYCEISNIEINVKETMKAPIYMYYQLEGFYQNHRKYSESRNDDQLAGQDVSNSTLESDCYPYHKTNNSQKIPGAEGLVHINPCGLIAWSMFNDSFILKTGQQVNDTIICDSSYKKPYYNCTNEGIAWWSDETTKFKHPGNGSKYLMYPYEYDNELGHKIPLVTDPDLIVWMRTAALPNFRKLLRIINVDLEPGTYYMDVKNRFPVSTFGGKKRIVLTTALPLLGTRNLFLPIAYLVVSGFSFILAVIFGIAYLFEWVYKKRKPNVNDKIN